MSENYTIKEEKRKRPVMLIILLVCTSLSLLGTFFMGVTPITSGPKSEEQLAKDELELAKSKVALKQFISDEETIQSMGEALDLGYIKMVYIHTKAYWIYHLFQVLIFACGAGAVYYMYHLKKLGFHLYIIYSLIGVGYAYLVFPAELIVGSQIIGGLIFSGLLVMLYARHLKDFELNDSDNEQSYTYNS